MILVRVHRNRSQSYVARKGLLLKRGSIVDARSSRRQGSTKNAEGERDEADVEQVEELLHGKEEVVHADAGYSGA